MKIVYMGTPEFAVGALDALIEAGHEVCAVVTQPDRRRGRGQELIFSPVKECAIRHDIEVLQPEKARSEEFVEKLSAFGADVFVVAAYGQLLTKEVLNIPKYGCINIHASLLPAYRGAAPIQWSIIDGQKETGITIMRMDEGLDTGDIMLQRTVEVESCETGGSLHDKLSATGAELIVSALSKLERNEITYVSQPQLSTTKYAKMLNKEMGEIDWKMSAKEIDYLIRGLCPWPSAYTFYDGKILKIWSADVINAPSDQIAGTVFNIDKKGFSIACGEGSLRIKELQLQGKKRMDAAAFLRGNALTEGITFGEKN